MPRGGGEQTEYEARMHGGRTCATARRALAVCVCTTGVPRNNISRATTHAAPVTTDPQQHPQPHSPPSTRLHHDVACSYGKQDMCRWAHLLSSRHLVPHAGPWGVHPGQRKPRVLVNVQVWHGLGAPASPRGHAGAKRASGPRGLGAGGGRLPRSRCGQRGVRIQGGVLKHGEKNGILWQSLSQEFTAGTKPAINLNEATIKVRRCAHPHLRAHTGFGHSMHRLFQLQVVVVSAFRLLAERCPFSESNKAR
jgi:hypothetical protein